MFSRIGRIFSELYRHYANSIIGNLPKDRLLALDVFRGMTIAAMVLVNNPGSWSYVYPPLLHANWHGLTPTDLIFPFFVFIVGVSIAIVHQRNVANQTNKKRIVKTAFVRASKLVLLGLFIALFYYDTFSNQYNWIEEQLFSVRVMGVLQRLALVFLFTMLLVTYLKTRWLWVTSFILLTGYWLLMLFVSYADADGNVYQGQLEFGNNLAAWLDSQIFSSKHLYYADALPFAFDPEGVLSTLPAISGCLFGVFTGQLLLAKNKDIMSKTKSLVFAGLLSLALGYIWGGYFPVNKAMWTSSYVLVTTGYALLVLALLIYMLDIKKVQAWSAPFVVFGANAIFFYVFSAVVERISLMVPIGDISAKGWLYSEVFLPVFGNYNGSLMYAVVFLLLSYVVMHQLYKRQIFFKV